MEVTKQASETGSFLDYTQGPSNIDVHPVYATSHTGASKGLLSSRNLVTYVLDGADTQQRHLNTEEVLGTHLNGVESHLNGVQTHLNGAEAHFNGVETHLNGVETFANQVENHHHHHQQVIGDATNDLHTRAENLIQGSSHIVPSDNVVVQRIDEALIVGADASTLNTQAIAMNNQASSNLVNHQHELLHHGEQRLMNEVNTHTTGLQSHIPVVNSHIEQGHQALNTGIESHIPVVNTHIEQGHQALNTGIQSHIPAVNTHIEQGHQALNTGIQTHTHNLESNLQNAQKNLVNAAPINLNRNNENTQQKITNEQLSNATNPAANFNHGAVVTEGNVNQEGDVVGQQQVQAFDTDSKAGLVTKGTLIFKPVEFRFLGEKNDKMAKVKPIFKAKVGGHHKTSQAGKAENGAFTWTEPISVGYSNQDDATLEIKKAGMFGKTIAAGKIALAEIVAQRTAHEQTVQLLDKERVVGELRVVSEFKPKAK